MQDNKTFTGLTIINKGCRVNVYTDREIQRGEHKKLLKKLIGKRVKTHKL